MKQFSREQLEWLRNNVKGRLASDLTLLFNKRFKENVTIDKIRRAKKNHKMPSCVSTTFKKGHIPANKNKPVSKEQYAKMAPTMFKKGENIRTKPIGTTRKDNKDGYIYIKIKQPNKWIPKHIYLWTKKNGPIPKGHVLVFLDGNRENCNVNNLSLISRKQLVIINRRKLLTKNKATNKASIVLSKLIDTINVKKHKRGIKQ